MRVLGTSVFAHDGSLVQSVYIQEEDKEASLSKAQLASPRKKTRDLYTRHTHALLESTGTSDVHVRRWDPGGGAVFRSRYSPDVEWREGQVEVDL